MKKAIGCAITLLILISGCSTTKVEMTGTDIKEEPAKVLQVGVTTKAEIIKHYGEPTNISVKEGSEELTYESKTVETPSYMGGLVINEAGRAITLKRLELVIRDGVVQSYKFEASGE